MTTPPTSTPTLRRIFGSPPPPPPELPTASFSAPPSSWLNSTERLVHQFAKALSVRISRHLEQQYQPQPRLQPQFYDMIASNSTVFTSSICKEHFLPWTSNNNNNINSSSSSSSVDDDFFQSCYLWVNQITPFIRFSHLTANQAILDATETTSTNHAGVGAVIHILDLDITQGLQWPPFMQALSERSSTNPSPVHAPSPPILRITGCGRDLTRLNRTGDRLSRFAHSLGLRFEFHPLLLHDGDPASLALRLRDPESLSVVPEEILAVNCVHYLHNLVTDDPRDIRMVLSAIKALNPRIVTAAEREANHGATAFAQRFSEAVDHYAAVFESLEATLPPNSRERLTLEQWWFGREIMDIIAAEEAERRQRHQRYEVWEAMFRSSGFCNVPIGGFALSQAKLLLRLHYPSEGYKLQSLKNSLFLGWQNHLLFSVSSWR
ncbi:PREDICTED: scarecrow-like protein 18 [Tarenaya hassleriana]|uniref:scarecrow-like protein 18 n=1 Tax=Tarenaya hassleriana TaxID=28532 RepID=UPI00053C299B|nr:PREDICTED: scarecrow-like protein 18 [Tarenaya hassleriana]